MGLLRGKFDIIIQNRQATYKFTLKRNITILQGDSAVGKSFLITLINRYNTVKNSGISVYIKSSLGISADLGEMTYDIWKNRNIVKNRIYFIEETQDFIKEDEFAEFLAETGIYVVLITRDSIPSLPYSVCEIYSIETRDGLHTFEPLYKFNGDLKRPDVIVTEDSKSGNDFFTNTLDIKCLGAGGNGNIYNIFKNKDLNNSDVLVIADGAAFGAHITKFNELSESYRLQFYLPESFEWLILNSGVFKVNDLHGKLYRTYDYVEASDCFSWENYYVELLTNITKDKHYAYDKSNLADYYKYKTVAANILCNSSLNKMLFNNLDLIKSSDVVDEFLEGFNSDNKVRNDVLKSFRVINYEPVSKLNLNIDL